MTENGSRRFTIILKVEIHNICIFRIHVVIYSPCYGKYVAKYRQTDAVTHEPEATEMRCKNPRSGTKEEFRAKGAGGRNTASRTVGGTERKQGNFPHPLRLRAVARLSA